MNLLAMLQHKTVDVPKQKQQKPKRVGSAGSAALRARADARYALLLTGKELSTTEIAAAFGNSHCGTLSSLLRLEERGKVKRVGERPRAPGVLRGRGATVWTWVANT